MRLCYRILLAAMLALGVSAAHAGLAVYFAKARLADPDFASAQAAYRSEVESRAIGRSGLMPTVSVAAESSRSRLDRRDVGSAVSRGYEFDPRTLSFRLSQPLFDLERWAAFKEGDARAERAEIVVADAKQELVLRLAQAYFNHLLAIDNLDLARAQREALAAQRVQTENLLKAGIATQTDVEETKARELLAQAQQIAAANALELRSKELAKIVGEPPTAAVTVVQPRLLAPEPAQIAQWVDAARNRNLKVLALRAQLTISDFQIDRSRAGYAPSLSLVASHRQGKSPSYVTDRDSESQIGVQLAMNLFEGGRTEAGTRQAVAQRDKIRSDTESALRDAEIKASQAYLEIVNGIAQIKAMEQAVKSAETVLFGMQTGQRLGLRTNTDVLNAQQQLFSARRDLQRERYAYLMNRLQLLAAVGGITDDEIVAVDRLAGVPDR